MIAPDRRQTERPMVTCVRLGTNAEQREVQQPNRNREPLLPREAPSAEVRGHAFAHPWQPVREREHPVELLGVSSSAPALVVQVLAPSGRVGAGRLEVTHRIRADPDVGPRGRDRERADAPDRVLVGHRGSLRTDVGEAAAAALPPDPRALARHPSKTRHRALVLPEICTVKREERRGPLLRGYLPRRTSR